MTLWEQYREMAAAAGVNKKMFLQRCRNWGDPVEAATTPPIKPGQQTKRRIENRWAIDVLPNKNRRRV